MHLNLYAIPALIACIFSALIGIYVFYKNPKNIQNRVFILFILFVVVFSIAEAMLRFSNSREGGLLWGRIGYLGVIFVPMVLLHLSFVFPREKIMFTRKNKYVLFSLYIIGIGLSYIFNLIVSIQDVKLSDIGYRVALNSSTFFIGIWCIFIIVFAVFNLLKSYRLSRFAIEKKQVKYVFYGGLIGAISSIGTNIIPPAFGIEVFPFATLGLAIFGIFVGAAILKYNLFRFKSMVEPTLEEKKTGRKKYELQSGKSYILLDEQVKQGYEIFIDQITHDISGLNITKYLPQKIRDEYNLKTTLLLWFTFEQSNKEKIINPKRLDVELIPQIEDFVKKGKNTMVYMDCLDQITLVKGFDNTLTLINDIRNICRENNSILLISVNPEIFDKEQLSFFEKSFLEVR